MKFKRELRAEDIRSKIEQILESLNFIEETMPADFKGFKDSKIIRNALYKEVEFALENILDICSIINADLMLGMPEVEDDIIANLKAKKIFDKKIIDKIREMKKFRNILIHKYGKIDDKKAFEDIKEGLKDFELIIKEIENFLKKYNGKANRKE